jgi:hypothetical protein
MTYFAVRCTCQHCRSCSTMCNRHSSRYLHRSRWRYPGGNCRLYRSTLGKCPSHTRCRWRFRCKTHRPRLSRYPSQRPREVVRRRRYPRECSRPSRTMSHWGGGQPYRLDSRNRCRQNWIHHPAISHRLRPSLSSSRTHPLLRTRRSRRPRPLRRTSALRSPESRHTRQPRASR